MLSKVTVIGLSGVQFGRVIYPWIISSLLSALQTSQVLNISTYAQLKNELIVKPNASIELKYLPPAAARLTFPAFFQPSNEDNVSLRSRRYGEWPEKMDEIDSKYIVLKYYAIPETASNPS